jgi:hypothetical protein
VPRASTCTLQSAALSVSTLQETGCSPPLFFQQTPYPHWRCPLAREALELFHLLLPMSPSVNSSPRRAFITGSRRGDLLVLFAFMTVMVCVSPWLRVYHRITAFELTLDYSFNSPALDESVIRHAP